jgi:hypothetical protein
MLETKSNQCRSYLAHIHKFIDSHKILVTAAADTQNFVSRKRILKATKTANECKRITENKHCEQDNPLADENDVCISLSDHYCKVF